MSDLPIPKSWNVQINGAILQAISLARHCLVSVTGRMANSPKATERVVADNERLKYEVQSLREELRLKDARMSRLPAQRRPHYSATERLSILELRAAQGWNLAQTARRFLLSPATVSSWMGRLDTPGGRGLVRTREPVNKFPDFVRYLVQWLKVTCPLLGKVKIAQILCRAGLHLGPSTVGRMIKEPRPAFSPAAKVPTSGSVVIAERPNHVWHIDLTAVSTTAGFWTSWSPFAVPQRWPFCWWIAVILDHYSRRVQGFAVFEQKPDSRGIIRVLARAIRHTGATPKYLISDQEGQFGGANTRAWCFTRGITQRFGAVGEHGSIAVLERLILTMKEGCTRVILVPLKRAPLIEELDFFFAWYNGSRPHMTLNASTPNEVYHDLPPATEQPRFEPRLRWPSTAPCTAPQVPVRSRSGSVHVRVDFLHGRKHLPVVALSHAA